MTMNLKSTFLSASISVSSLVSFGQFISISNSPLTSEELESRGIAWIDYDNDGDDDLFITISYSSGISSKDMLYQNNGDGTFTQILTGNLVSEEGTGRNSTWGDYDNDGLVDVFVSNQGETLLYKNMGNGSFTKVLTIPTTSYSSDSDHSGGAWGDYNSDGFLDLFLASYKLNDNARNVLFTNNKDGSFSMNSVTDVISANGPSMDPAWIDYDNNGTLDLFVPNYYGTNFLYSNAGDGTFKNISTTALTSQLSDAVGSSWADYDNDGDFDVLIQINVNTPNLFYENNGDGTFTNKGNELSTASSTSAAWGDFNNDGWIDLVMVGSGMEGKTKLFKNNGDKTFTDVSAQQGITNTNYSWAVAWSDYDKNGFLDFFIANAFGNNLPANDILYRNTPNGNGWVNIKLTGTNSNRSAIGAILSARVGQQLQWRTIQAKTGNSSQNSLNVHFGIGTADKVDTLYITWPNGSHRIVADITKNQFMQITEQNTPSIPSNLTSINTGPDNVQLSWNDNSSNETGFRIERSKESSKNFSTVFKTGPNVTQFIDQGLQEGVTYYYRVASIANESYSPFTATSSVLIKKKQTITISPIGEKFGDSLPFHLIANATSGLPITFILLDGQGKVSLSGDLVTILSLGQSKLGAFQSGNDIYYHSDTTTQILNVSLITQIERTDQATIIYPNPVKDKLIIKGLDQVDTTPVNIFNAIGQTVLSVNLNSANSEIIVKDLQPGFYIVSVRNSRFKILKLD